MREKERKTWKLILRAPGCDNRDDEKEIKTKSFRARDHLAADLLAEASFSFSVKQPPRRQIGLEVIRLWKRNKLKADGLIWHAMDWSAGAFLRSCQGVKTLFGNANYFSKSSTRPDNPKQTNLWNIFGTPSEIREKRSEFWLNCLCFKIVLFIRNSRFIIMKWTLIDLMISSSEPSDKRSFHCEDTSPPTTTSSRDLMPTTTFRFFIHLG